MAPTKSVPRTIPSSAKCEVPEMGVKEERRFDVAAKKIENKLRDLQNTIVNLKTTLDPILGTEPIKEKECEETAEGDSVFENLVIHILGDLETSIDDLNEIIQRSAV